MIIMVEIQQSKDNCIDHLTVTDGQELEIMANLKSTGQIDAVLEGHLSLFFGSDYGVDKFRTLLRTSISWQGKGRDGIEAIGKTPDVQGNFLPRDSN